MAYKTVFVCPQGQVVHTGIQVVQY